MLRTLSVFSKFTKLNILNMSDGRSDEIEDFEDSEEQGLPWNDQEEDDTRFDLEDDEFQFLDAMSELATLQSELYEVRGKLADARSQGKYVPLKLYRSHCHNSLSVSDIQSGLWCERQLEYRYLHPHMKCTKQWKRVERERGKEIKKKTEVMVKGSTIHLKKELEVHEPVVVMTVTREDTWAVRLLNTYKQLTIVKEGKMEREISLFGDLFDMGILLNGIIDQLQFEKDTQELIVTDLKTRRSNSLPMTTQAMGHRLQLMVYKMLLDGFTRGTTKMELLIDHLKLNFSASLSRGVRDYINDIGLKNTFTSPSLPEEPEKELKLTFGDLVHTISKLIRGLDLPPVTSMKILYEYQATNEVIGVLEVSYEEGLVRETLESALKFWKGDREPRGPDIEDLWKCETCQFQHICVWNKQKHLEASPGVKILESPVKSPAVKISKASKHKDTRISASIYTSAEFRQFWS